MARHITLLGFIFESALAEGEGFEPPVAHHHGWFQDSRGVWRTFRGAIRTCWWRLCSPRPRLVAVIGGFLESRALGGLAPGRYAATVTVSSRGFSCSSGIGSPSSAMAARWSAIAS